MTTTLRQLSNAYAKGALDQDAYRSARTNLIERILSGEVVLHINVYPDLVAPPESESLEVTERKSEKKKAPTSAPESTPGKPISKILVWISITCAVIIIILTVTFLYKSSNKTAQIQQDNITEFSTASESGSSIGSASRQLIETFLNENSWSDDHVKQFLRQWESLSAEEKASANASVEIGQLANAIYRQLQEERALSSLGDAEDSLDKQTLLVMLADSVSIVDARISLPKKNTSAGTY